MTNFFCSLYRLVDKERRKVSILAEKNDFSKNTSIIRHP